MLATLGQYLQIAVLLVLIVAGELIMLAGMIETISPSVLSRRFNLPIAFLGLLLFMAASLGLIQATMP